MVENKYSEEEISVVLAESREARKHLREVGRVVKIVAAHRLKELRHLQAVDNLVTWRRTLGFDRTADDDDQWASRPLSPTPEQFTASLWPDLNELKDQYTCVYLENDNDMEKKEVGRMNPERDQLESPSASTDFETPGEQCHPN